MKKLTLLGVFSIVTFSINAQSNLNIQGKFNTSEKIRMIYLNYMTLEGLHTDSSELIKNTFSFKVSIQEPTFSTLTVRFESAEAKTRPRVDKMDLFLEKGKITIEVKDSLRFAKVSGSKSDADFRNLNKMQKEFFQRN